MSSRCNSFPRNSSVTINLVVPRCFAKNRIICNDRLFVNAQNAVLKHTLLSVFRHMKIHEKDSVSSIPNSPTLSLHKRRRSSTAKRKLSHDEDIEKTEEKTSKKVSVVPLSYLVPKLVLSKLGNKQLTVTCVLQVKEDSVVDEQSLNKGQEEVLTCPICFKTLTCRNDFDTHMETHPDTTLRYKPIHQQIQFSEKCFQKCNTNTRDEFNSGLTGLVTKYCLGFDNGTVLALPTLSFPFSILQLSIKARTECCPFVRGESCIAGGRQQLGLQAGSLQLPGDIVACFVLEHS